MSKNHNSNKMKGIKSSSSSTEVTSNHIRNRLDGNKLDLSLMGLEEIPLKDVAQLSGKASQIDLSCNRIVVIPPAFCDLTTIVWLDLSKNSISNLPNTFGHLYKLQHLDLYNNNIQVLPVSFSQLKALKWLDLKNNPLENNLKKVAGDCLDAKQCQTCAKKVVSFMKMVEDQLINDQNEDNKKRMQAEDKKRKAQDKEKEKSQPTGAKKVVKEKSSKELVQQQAPKSPGGADKTGSRIPVVVAKPAHANGTKAKATQKRGVLNAEANRVASASAKVLKRKKKSEGCWPSFTWFVIAAFVLLAGLVLAVLLNIDDEADVSFEEFQRQLPIVADRAIKAGRDLSTATVDHVAAWLRKDGAEIMAWFAENICAGVTDVVEIFGHTLVHLQLRVLEFFENSAANAATVTTNAKRM